jgi:hypothetical protein|tara:strand:- start:60 stop:251 length:192 start_codon:yes stop_codon:yes gene_type:complete
LKVGDLVTVYPAAVGLYLVTNFLRDADTEEAQLELGSLWELYGEGQQECKMHEKWIEVISENW